MAKVLAFFAEGTEEIECLTVVDILRRGGVDVDLVSITKNKEVCGSHKIRVICDKVIDDADLDSAELLFLPGGIPGVPHLEENQIVIHALKAQKSSRQSVLRRVFWDISAFSPTSPSPAIPVFKKELTG